MDSLDKILKEKRDSFEKEPVEGHFERFEEKLERLHTKKIPPLHVGTFLMIAALVIIVLLSANLFVYLLPQEKMHKDLGFANQEMNETAHFYNTRISSGLSQLQQMADQGIGSKQELLQVKKEMEEMDKLHQELQKEYSTNSNDERVINAMIEYYQSKLNIINTIKSDLENVKSIKNKNHENTNL